MVADRPDAAYEICTRYAPNCEGTQGSSSSSSRSRSSGSQSSGSLEGSFSGQSSGSRSESSSGQSGASTGGSTSQSSGIFSSGILSGSSSSQSSRSADSGSRSGDSNSKITGDQSSSQSTYVNGRSQANNSATPRVQNDRSSGVDGGRFRDIAVSSSGDLNGNLGSNVLTHDFSGESDGGLGGFNSEDDYYDSMNTVGERPGLGTFVERKPIEPVYNPEPGIDDNVYNNAYDRQYENASSQVEDSQYPSTSNTTTYSTIVNGVKLTSLPGPRGFLLIFTQPAIFLILYNSSGTQGTKGDKGDPGEKGDFGRGGIDGIQGAPGSPGHVFMVPVRKIYTFN